MSTITPYLWFTDRLEEAVSFYLSIFKNARLLSMTHIRDTGPDGKQTVVTASFELNGQRFMALEGGPHFQFSPAVSFFVDCDTQEEVDFLWEKLLEGGQAQQCGWLTDRYGVTWQVIPKLLGQLMSDPDPVKVKRVTHAMLQMVKLESAGLQRAYDGEA